MALKNILGKNQCFSTVLQFPPLLLEQATWANPSKNLDSWLRFTMLGVEVDLYSAPLVIQVCKRGEDFPHRREALCAHLWQATYAKKAPGVASQVSKKGYSTENVLVSD